MRTEDGHIINKCLNGDPAAFGFLVDKYKESVYAFAYDRLRNFHDAEDVTQEVFIKAYQKLRTLRRWDSFLAWLYSITSNVCKMWSRAQSRRPDTEFIEDEGIEILESRSVDSYREDMRRELLRDMIDEALDSLPGAYRQVLIFHYLGGMSNKEIARFLGTSPTAVKQRLMRARSRLREEMLAMMSRDFEERRLPVGFTFNIVESVKRMKIQPMPRTAGLPWGVSLATGIIVAVLSLGSHLSLSNLLNTSMDSASAGRISDLGEIPVSLPFPGEITAIETGAIPADIREIPRTSMLSSQPGSANVERRDLKNNKALSMAPGGQDYVHVRSWPDEVLGLRYTTDVAVDDSGNTYVADAGNYCVQKFAPDGSLIAKWGSQGSEDGQFEFFEGIGIDREGHVYVADSGNNRIQKFDSEGNFLMKWGTYGSGNGKLSGPWSLAFDKSGNVYVGDKWNCRIQVFDSGGRFLRKWGTEGFGDGQLKWPKGMAIDGSGDIYVADIGNNRIQKFDSEGNFMLKWGSPGSTDGKFSCPKDIALDSMGNIYIADIENDRIQKFDSSGNFLLKWGTMGSGEGQFGFPEGVETDKEGNVYVVERFNNRVQKFDPNGQLLDDYGYEGSEDGQFNRPEGLAVDGSGRIYVADSNNHRIQVFDPSGDFLWKFGVLGRGDGQLCRPNGVVIDESGNIFVADKFNFRIQKFDSDGNFLTKWGSLGSGNGQFAVIYGIAVDDSGYVYVVDTSSNRVQKFDSEGRFIAKWGTKGTGDGQFREPVGIAIDDSGDIYVPDYYNHRVQVFDSEGRFLSKWGSKGSSDGCFEYPTNIAVDNSGKIYVLDYGNSRIQVFNSEGEFLAKWGSRGVGDGQFMNLSGIAVDKSGYVYISDSRSNRIQKFRPFDLAVDSTDKLTTPWGDVKNTNDDLPGVRSLSLGQNYPNPSNPETWIPFYLSEPEHVKIRIYSLRGDLVRTLDLGEKLPGAYLSKDKAAYWDGTNEEGEEVASGTYFYTIRAGEFVDSRKMIVLR